MFEGAHSHRRLKSQEAAMQAPADLPSYPSQSAPSSRPMIVTTTENIPEARVVKTLGQVFGLTVRSRAWEATSPPP